MCRNIRPLNNFEPPATDDEVSAAALQFVRKVSGTTKPSAANQAAFDRAVHDIAHVVRHLVDELVTTAPPKNREVEAAKAREPGGAAVRTVTLTGARVAPGSSTTESVLELLSARPLVVLTGAGCSTDSGIPDYRGPNSPARMPMTYQEFVSGPAAQQRYWGRSHLGWARMKRAEPNPGHHALARIDPELLITQNVDGLHERAGSRRVVALHGRISEVVCLSCREVTSRAELHERLTELNPRFAERNRRRAGAPGR